MDAELCADLARQVEVDLRLGKGWAAARCERREDVWMVTGRLSAKDEARERLVVPVPASASLTPRLVDSWLRAAQSR